MLELHGWGDLHPRLNSLSKKGEWTAMGDLIDDEVLDSFAVVAPLGEIPEIVRNRFGALVDRFSFYAPYPLEPEALREIVHAFKLGNSAQPS